MSLVVVGPDGCLRTLGGDNLPLEGLGVVHKRRASHILPLNNPKRAVFRLLRRVFGEKGRVAAWTRTWRGPWEAHILATGERFVSWNRQSCLDWEHSTINLVTV